MRTCGWCLELSVFFLVSFVFYLVSPLFFQPFLMSTSAPNERSMSNPLCYSSLGSVVTSDYVTPLTFLPHIPFSLSPLSNTSLTTTPSPSSLSETLPHSTHPEHIFNTFYNTFYNTPSPPPHTTPHTLSVLPPTSSKFHQHSLNTL